ncbi:hypothetical protein [Ruegeria meonggei]|uniref:hypothetical protein n=1 Tax=Ruegeria meonggei TaxID=1446476 RepID=UPI00366F7E97
MSDEKGSTGNFDKGVSAQISKSWEARLEEARNQRALALAQNTQPAKQEEPSDRASVAVQDDPVKTDVEPTPLVAKPPLFKSQNKHRTDQNGRRLFAVVLASMLAGGFLYWGGSSVISNWKTADDSTWADQSALAAVVVIENEDPQPAETELSQVPVPAIDQTDLATDLTMAMTPNRPDIFNPPEDIQAPTLSVTPTGLPLMHPPKYQSPVQPPVLHAISLPLEELVLTPDSITQSASQLYDKSQNPAHFFGPYLPDNATDSIRPTNEEAPTAPKTKAAIDVSLFVPVQVSVETSEKAMQVLTDGKANVSATARVGYSVRETQVRYYHPNDAEMAISVAGALGGISRDFTNAGRKTRPGRIEVYLAGRGGRVASEARVEQTQFDQFVERLLKELQ